MDALLEKDEETDAGVFTAYLRAQSDADLMDIVLHMDPERYPARVDAARRETLRRRVLPVTVHGTEERFIRGLALAALALAVPFVLLTALLTADDLAAPAGQDFDRIPDGTPVSALMRLALLGLLRVLVAGSAHLALLPLALLALGGWLTVRAGSHAIRADVKRLVLLSCLVSLAAFLFAAAPFSRVPGLFDPSADGEDFGARLLTLLRGS